MSDPPPLRFYGELAAWWPLVSPPEEYEEEAAFAATLLGEAREVLELGSGGGNNASHLKARFAMTLVDLSEEMLDVSRRLNRTAPTTSATCAPSGWAAPSTPSSSTTPSTT